VQQCSGTVEVIDCALVRLCLCAILLKQTGLGKRLSCLSLFLFVLFFYFFYCRLALVCSMACQMLLCFCVRDRRSGCLHEWSRLRARE